MRDELPRAELREIFDTEVRPFIDALRFGQAESSTGRPSFISVGGQPGAGKGKVISQVQKAHPGSAIVNGDDLRQFHPDYQQLISEAPLQMPQVTSQASGNWVGMTNEYLRTSRASAVVETTLRQPDVLLREFKSFKDAGYETELRVVAVPVEVSRLGTVTRYLEQVNDQGFGRWTPGEHHDITALAVPNTVETLVSSGLVDRLLIQDRDGGVLLDTEAYAGGTNLGKKAAAAVETARDLEVLSPKQAQTWLRRVEHSCQEQIRLKESDPDFLRVLEKLRTTDAAAVASRAFPGSSEKQLSALERLKAVGNSPELGEQAPNCALKRFPTPRRQAPRSKPPYQNPIDLSRAIVEGAHSADETDGSKCRMRLSIEKRRQLWLKRATKPSEYWSRNCSARPDRRNSTPIETMSMPTPSTTCRTLKLLKHSS